MRPSNNNTNNCVTPKQLQLYSILQRLWVEHVMWTRSFIVSASFDLNDLNAITNRLLRNPKDFANLLRPFYGEQNSTKFEQLFTEHLLIAAELVKAAKAGNNAAVVEQRRKWYANADEIAVFLNSINPYWSKKVWQILLYDHLKMTENEAVQILTGKYDESIVQYDSIQEEALEMADVMAQGIIMQK